MVFFICDYLAQATPALDSYTSWSCNLFKSTFHFIPSSPITLQGIADGIGESLPFIGGRLIYMALADLGKVLSVVVTWKVFQALPGKF